MVSETNVLSVQRFESGPVEPKTSDNQIVSPDGDLLATSKQEEWITRKKTELVTTKQIETRVKRQVVLEDGKVVEDSGPLVTTTTTEDTDKNESEQTEHKEHGGDAEIGEGWIPVESVPDDAVVKESNERKITTHDEVEDVLETEEVKHLGDVSSRDLVRAIREGSGDTRNALLGRERNELVSLSPYDKSVAAQRRIIHQSRRHDRTTDINDTKEVSKVNEKGNLVTEITKRHEHEEFHNEDIPDSDSDEFEHVETREGSHDYSHAKNENFIEYLTFQKGQPVKIREGGRVVEEKIRSERTGDDDLWDSVSERIKKGEIGGNGPSKRSDALTSKPLNFTQEEHRRKDETDKWLTSHFGSSTSSLNSESSPTSPISPTGIRVTMSSTSNSSPPPPLTTKIVSSLKKSSYQKSPHRQTGVQKDVKFNLNSQLGKSSEGSTPTPPPRSKRNRNSPDIRQHALQSPTQKSAPYERNFFSSSSPTNQLKKSIEMSDKRGHERRDQKLIFSGKSPQNSYESYNMDDELMTKENSYYRANEHKNSPESNRHEQDFRAETKEFERRQNLGFLGSSLGRRMKPEEESHSSLPRRKFYFGDDEGSLNKKVPNSQNFNVSISSNVSGKLNRSSSFSPHVYKSNPALLTDLQSPKLINVLSRSVRDVSSEVRGQSNDRNYSEISGRRNKFEPSPCRSITPTHSYSPR